MTAPTLTRPEELADAGLVPADRLPELRLVAARYALAIPPAMAALIDPEDPADPIARQFVPDLSELDVAPEERADPIGDAAYAPVKGIVHRYPDRVLLKPIHACAVYCRFCFRREMVGPGSEGLSDSELEAALAYVAGDPNIWEVVITGGDPLMLSPRRLAQMMARLSAIPHLAVIRFHTRIPVVAPQRIDAALVAALESDKAVYVVLHANHARELGDDAAAACARLIRAGIPMLAQTVLLKDVNDRADTLEALFRRLVSLRIKPYHLHHGDLAPGTAGFRTTIEAGHALMRSLQGDVSGLCLPTYVLDLPGGHGKVPLGPDYLEAGAGEGWIVTDYRGGRHAYPAEAGPGIAAALR